ncbi:MAG TPA: glycosyl transferase [Solibacterales bacterium]|nr:glycosyl transferase [Bryobacterales bacterium]
MRLSVVVVSRNEGEWLRRTVEGLEPTLPADAETIVVDDGSTDGSAAFLTGTKARVIRTRGVGVARARNAGARRAAGSALIFLDGHMVVRAGWWEPLLEALERPRAGAAAPAMADTNRPRTFGYGFTIPTPGLQPRWLPSAASRPFHAPVLPGACLAMPRPVFEAVGGFDEGLRGRGGVDIETSLRLWLLGYENWVVPEARVWHAFRREAPYPMPPSDAIHNRLRLACVHLQGKRVARVMEAQAGEAGIVEAVRKLCRSNVDLRRRDQFSRRVRNDDWFFRRFGIVW